MEDHSFLFVFICKMLERTRTTADSNSLLGKHTVLITQYVEAFRTKLDDYYIKLDVFKAKLDIVLCYIFLEGLLQK